MILVRAYRIGSPFRSSTPRPAKRQGKCGESHQDQRELERLSELVSRSHMNLQVPGIRPVAVCLYSLQSNHPTREWMDPLTHVIDKEGLVRIRLVDPIFPIPCCRESFCGAKKGAIVRHHDTNPPWTRVFCNGWKEIHPL